MAASRVVSEWKKLRPYLSLLDFTSRPTTRLGWYVRIGATLFALFTLYRRVEAATAPLLHAKPPPVIPNEEIEDYRFRLPERTRREIFAELADAEMVERRRAIEQNTWNGHAWSREDDRGHFERVEARRLAAKHHVSLTQIYLVLDEGIREHWEGPDGRTLPATTPPLTPRNTW